MTNEPKRRRWWCGALGVAVALALGCSGRATSSEDGDETSGEAEGTSAEHEGSSAGSASDGLDGTTDAATCEWDLAPLAGDVSATEECADLVSSGEAAPVTVRIVNEGDAVVWLTGTSNCSNSHVAIEDAAGQRFSGTHCTFPCEASLLGECGCLTNCPLVDTIALQPGGAFETSWPGYVLEPEPRQASEACAGDCAGECTLRTAPAEGPLRVTVARTAALDCDGCGCEPTASGWCEVPGQPFDWSLDVVELVEHMVQWPPECPVIELAVR